MAFRKVEYIPPAADFFKFEKIGDELDGVIIEHREKTGQYGKVQEVKVRRYIEGVDSGQDVWLTVSIGMAPIFKMPALTRFKVRYTGNRDNRDKGMHLFDIEVWE